MSLSYVPLQPVLLQDPITDVQAVDKYAILQGGNKISSKAFTSTSISSSSINFSCPPPSSNIITSRSVKFTLPVRLTLTGALITNNGAFTPSSTLINANKDAPRAFALSSMIDTINVKLNNDSVSIPMSDVIHPLQHYNTCTRLKEREYSTDLTYCDQSFNYLDLDGTNKNPLGVDGNCLEGTVRPRGGFPFNIVSNPSVTPATGAGTAATAVVDMVLTEDLFLSPFFWGDSQDNVQGFYNITNMDFYFTFLAQAAFRLWSHCNQVQLSGANVVNSVISSASVQFNGFSSPAFSYSTNSPLLQFDYISPNLLTHEKLGPNIPVTYPFFDIQRYPTDFPAITYSQGPVTISSNNIQLSCIPRRIYIFARPTNQTLQSRCDLTDCYLAIKNVSIQWANNSVLLASATQQQLYYINVRNGSDQSWASWSGEGVYDSGWTSKYGGQGSILCLSMGQDVQLDADECPGKNGQYQLQVNCTFQNMNSRGDWNAIPMTMYLVVVNEGTFTVTAQGSCVHNIGVVSAADILDAQSRPGINYREVQRLNGGDFLSGLRSFASKVNDFLKQTKILSTVGKAVGSVVPGVGVAANVAEKLGYGGVAIQGGKKLTKKQLQSRL